MRKTKHMTRGVVRTAFVSALAVIMAMCVIAPQGAGDGAFLVPEVIVAHADAPAPQPWDGKTIDVSWYSPSGSPSHIGTAEQLMGLAAIVNGIFNKEIETIITGWNGSTPTTVPASQGSPYIVDKVETGKNMEGSQNQATLTWHSGADSFNGKTVYLDSNIDMGSAGNFMPIGGQYLMEPNDEATKLSASFDGVFDGQGHWVKNIYASRRCTTGNFGDGESVGLIGRLGRHDNDEVTLRPEAPSVRNVAVAGVIRSNRSVGGVVGKIGKTVNGGTIENCANYADVFGSDAKGTGGIVGAGWNNGVIKNCFNAGTVTGGWPAGGIVGSNEIPIKNCFSIGTINWQRNASDAMAIGTNNSGAPWSKMENAYGLTGSAEGGGYMDSGLKPNNAGLLAGTAIKSAAFLTSTGAIFMPDGVTWEGESRMINDGYPILPWMTINPGLDITPIPREGVDPAAPTYTLLEPTNTTIYTGAEQQFSWIVDAPKGRFVSLWLEGNVVDAGSFVIEKVEKKTRITFPKGFLDTLPNGLPEITAEYAGGKTISLPLEVKVQGNKNGELGLQNIISKTKPEYDRGSGKDFVITIIRNISLYNVETGVTVDGSKIPAGMFTVTAETGDDGRARMTVRINAVWLAELAAGEHTIVVPFYGGTYASQTITATGVPPAQKGTETAPVDIGKGKAAVADVAWTGKKISRGFRISLNGKTLTEGKDYSVGKTGANKSIGTGTVTITGKGGYTGTKSLKFKIVPKNVTVKSIAAGKKLLTVKWGKAAIAQKITGYQMQWRVKGATRWSKVTSAPAKSVKYVIKKLDKGKKYEVRIRAYKKIKSGASKGTWNGAWSKAKLSGKVR